MSDPFRPNPRHLAAPDISGPNAAENVARALGFGGPVVDRGASGLVEWVHHDRREEPAGRYVTVRDPETRALVRVFRTNEEIAAAEAAEKAALQAEVDAMAGGNTGPVQGAETLLYAKAVHAVAVGRLHEYTKGSLARLLAGESELSAKEWAPLVRRLVVAKVLLEVVDGKHRSKRLVLGSGDVSRARTRRVRDTRAQAMEPSPVPGPVPSLSEGGREGPAVSRW